MNSDTGIGSVHYYDFDRQSWTPTGDILYPIPGGGDMAEVVVARTPTGHGTWWHETVRVPARDVLNHERRDVLATAALIRTTPQKPL